MSVHVWEAMGTHVSVRIPERYLDFREKAILDAKSVIQLLENEYSLYIEQSPISRLARKELELSEMSEEFRDTYARAIEWRNETGGAFTPHRSDGVIDLSGIVKADAIAAASAVLRAHGIEAFSFNFGGDIQVAGEEDWVVAIGNPTNPQEISLSVTLNSIDCAIATSGTFDRGEHIWRSVNQENKIVSATVVSKDIVTSDVWATAIVSGGTDAAAEASARGLAVLYFTEDLQASANEMMRGLINEETEQKLVLS